MADHRNKTSPSRNRNLDPTYDVYDEDPLVELARIVSEEGGYLNIAEDGAEPATAESPSRQAGRRPDVHYGNTAAAQELDLESQLMEELEISMSPPANAADEFGEPLQAYEQEPDLAPHPESEQRAINDFAADELSADEYSADEFSADEFAAEDFSAEDLAGEDFTAEDFAPVEGVPEDAPVAGSAELREGRSRYAFNAGENLSSEVSELLSEQELSELEQALAEAESLEDGEVGAQFDDEMGSAGAAEFGEIPGEIEDLDDNIYDVPPAIGAGQSFEGGDYGEERRSGRKVFAIAAVLSIAVLGGGVLFMMNSTPNDTVASAPPLIKAGDGPVKVAPEAGSDVASGDNQTMFDVAVTDSEPAREELIDRAEKPMERIVPATAENDNLTLRGSGGDDGKDATRLMANARDASSGSSLNPIGPKQVTTVKVNADGTIIRPSLDETGPAAQVDEEPSIVGGLPSTIADSPPATVAVDESRPVPVRVVEIKPNQPNSTASNDAAAAASNPLVTSSGAALTDQPTVSTDTATSADTSVPRSRPGDTPKIRVTTAQPSRSSGLVAQPAQRSGSGPVDLLNSDSGSQQVARAPVTPAAPANTGSTRTGSGYLVQLSAQRSESQALAAFDGLKRQYPSLLGDYKPSIQRADLGDRGIYYRVRVGPMESQNAANAFCEQLKSSGGSCFVTR